MSDMLDMLGTAKLGLVVIGRGSGSRAIGWTELLALAVFRPVGRLRRQRHAALRSCVLASERVLAAPQRGESPRGVRSSTACVDSPRARLTAFCAPLEYCAGSQSGLDA